jgi:PAS domain-containing protein
VISFTALLEAQLAFVNPRLCSLLGYSLNELLSQRPEFTISVVVKTKQIQHLHLSIGSGTILISSVARIFTS